MSGNGLNRWSEIRARVLEHPNAREQYERGGRSIDLMTRMIRLVEDRRRQLGWSQAELARRVGVHPSVIRRLLAWQTGNPPLKTLLDVMDALGIHVHVEVDGSGCPPDASHDADGKDGGVPAPEVAPIVAMTR